MTRDPFADGVFGRELSLSRRIAYVLVSQHMIGKWHSNVPQTALIMLIGKGHSDVPLHLCYWLLNVVQPGRRRTVRIPLFFHNGTKI